jgi:hypothetical protein
MRQSVRAWTTVTLTLVLAGCALPQTASPPIYRDDFLTVRLEPNPEVAAAPPTDTDARNVTADQLAVILKGLKARKRTGLLQSLLSESPHEPVFREDELPRVATALRSGLKAASPRDRVAFQLARTGGMEGREETSGVVYWRGPLLYMTLAKFRSPDQVSYDSPAEGFDLSYEPADAVVQPQRESERRWLGGRHPEVVINVQRFREPPVVATQDVDPGRKAERPAHPTGRSADVAGALQTVPAPAPPVMPASPVTPAPQPNLVESLQRQIKELKDSNQELRAKLQELQNLRDQSGELDRLRRELAETKQVLADKVIELNRIKSKAGGGAKGKAKP